MNKYEKLKFYFNKRSQLLKEMNSLCSKSTLDRIKELQNEIKEIDKEIDIINTKWYKRIPRTVNVLVNFLIIGLLPTTMGVLTLKGILLLIFCILSIIGYIEIILKEK